MSVNYLAIGKRIRKLRLAKKWTQDTLGYNAGVSKVHISHIEKATTKLSLPTIISIANALGTTVDYLLSENTLAAGPVFDSEVQDLIKDCDNYELSVIKDQVAFIKKAMRNITKEEADC